MTVPLSASLSLFLSVLFGEGALRRKNAHVNHNLRCISTLESMLTHMHSSARLRSPVSDFRNLELMAADSRDQKWT